MKERLKMRGTKIALKPYLDRISGYCDSLSNDELTDIIIGLAKDVPTSGRVEFLKKIESYLQGRKSAVVLEVGPVEQILDEIEALKESIEERIASIEDGTYWDSQGGWEDDGYDDDYPDYVDADQVQELESFFDDAENLFMNDRLEDAKSVYGALFCLINDIEKDAYFSLGPENDIRESRARYCRCVYETSDPDMRLDEFVEAMEIDASDPHDENEYNEDYPMMQDVIDARPGEMGGLESFLPAWKKVLTAKGKKARPAVLLLETVNCLEGVIGVSKLARKWKNTQPQGYLFWLEVLRKKNDQKGVIRVSKEALKALKKGRMRERVADFMMEAAESLNDAKHLLLAKHERFFSYTSDQNLLDLVAEATKQNRRDEELSAVIDSFKAEKPVYEEKDLYVKVLLMSGKLDRAVSETKNKKAVGWSASSSAGTVFAAVLSVLASHFEKATTIKTILRSYANSVSVYSGRFVIDEETSTSFYDEIVRGLKQKKNIEAMAAQSLSWAEKIGKKRIEHIVSNKYRGAYERAAQVLCSLAETHMAMGERKKAERILRRYYYEKYNRFSAFRSEVRAVIRGSDLLRESAFLS
jgi:hypothetical protein